MILAATRVLKMPLNPNHPSIHPFNVTGGQIDDSP